MSNADTILETFERAVSPQVEQLKVIAQTMGEVALQMSENNRSLNLWDLPQGEMQHSINNVLQTVMAVTLMGEFECAADNLSKQASRMERLETEMEASERPSVIVRSIKAEIDKNIHRQP